MTKPAHSDSGAGFRWSRNDAIGGERASGRGPHRLGLPEHDWHWADIHDADAAREAEIEARVAAAREQARKRKS